MPYYTLACPSPSCAHRFDVVCRWTDVATQACPTCGATGAEIVPMPTNFTIKGYAASTGYTHKKP